MTSLLLIILALVAQAPQSPAASAVARINAKVRVELVAGTVTSLAGHYNSKGGGLSGEDFYLFPDGTYIYTEWADIQPTTIYDKGKWTVQDGIITLASDPEIKEGVTADRRFVAVHRVTHGREILLMGLDGKLPFFEEERWEGNESGLLAVAPARVRALDTRESAKLKSRLMREAWRPEIEVRIEPTLDATGLMLNLSSAVPVNVEGIGMVELSGAAGDFYAPFSLEDFKPIKANRTSRRQFDAAHNKQRIDFSKLLWGRMIDALWPFRPFSIVPSGHYDLTVVIGQENGQRIESNKVPYEVVAR